MKIHSRRGKTLSLQQMKCECDVFFLMKIFMNQTFKNHELCYNIPSDYKADKEKDRQHENKNSYNCPYDSEWNILSGN